MTWFINHFNNLADKTALMDSFGSFTYRDLSRQIQTYKQQLDKTMADGQVVAILSDYNFYAVALFFTLLQKKAIVVPIVTANQNEAERRLSVAQCGWVIRLDKKKLNMTQNTLVAKPHAMVASLIDKQQSGLILFSSGSTGEPKAMIHNLDNLISSYEGKKTKNLNMLVFLMFDHIGGLNTLLNTLAMGAKIILPSNRNPEHVAQLIEKHSVHVLPASPTFLNLLLMAKVQENYIGRAHV